MKQEKNTFRQEKNEKRTTERLLAYATAMKQKQEAKNASKQNTRKSTLCQGKGGDFRLENTT